MSAISQWLHIFNRSSIQLLYLFILIYRFCVPINAETGTTVGEMRGHTKTVNAVAVRRDRPFRIATASEDQSICFYHGVPYKLNKQMDEVYMCRIFF